MPRSRNISAQPRRLSLYRTLHISIAYAFLPERLQELQGVLSLLCYVALQGETDKGLRSLVRPIASSYLGLSKQLDIVYPDRAAVIAHPENQARLRLTSGIDELGVELLPLRG